MQERQEVPSLDIEDPWSRKWQHAPVFLPGKFHGQRSLVGYSPWGHKELNMNEHKLFYLFAYFPSMPLYINTMRAKFLSNLFIHISSYPEDSMIYNRLLINITEQMSPIQESWQVQMLVEHLWEWAYCFRHMAFNWWSIFAVVVLRLFCTTSRCRWEVICPSQEEM